MEGNAGKEKAKLKNAEIITEIEKLRHDANAILANGGLGSPEILAISMKINELIVMYMRSCK